MFFFIWGAAWVMSKNLKNTEQGVFNSKRPPLIMKKLPVSICYFINQEAYIQA